MPDIKVLYRDDATGALSVGMARPPESISGIDLLVQNVTLLFLNNGGRSIFQPGRVGGLRDLIGINVDPDDPSELFADIQLMASRIEQTIKQEQTQANRPASERLQSLQLVDIVPSDDNTSVEIIVAVVNEEQQVAQAVVAT